MPRAAVTTKVGAATIGRSESSDAAGIVSESVSGAEMAYAARAGTVTRSSVSLSRWSCACDSVGWMTAFQPPGSSCRDTSPATSSHECGPAVTPMAGCHTSSLRRTVNCCGGASSSERYGSVTVGSTVPLRTAEPPTAPIVSLTSLEGRWLVRTAEAGTVSTTVSVESTLYVGAAGMAMRSTRLDSERVARPGERAGCTMAFQPIGSAWRAVSPTKTSPTLAGSHSSPSRRR